MAINLGERSYAVHFRADGLKELSERIDVAARARRVAIITDENVAPLHLMPLLSGLNARGLSVTSCQIRPGEAEKHLGTVSALYDGLLGWGMQRGTLIVALGGGVVGDIAGFVAGTLLRGIAWVGIPTTVLSQVDSSVGGKVGVNHASGKNLIGLFHQPTFVWVDTAYLRTLPTREARAGFAEVVKHAILGDEPLLPMLTRPAPDLLSAEPEVLLEILKRAVRVKADIVARDEHESGPRMALNLGHTLAHALEAETGYSAMNHGEAVALGLSFVTEWAASRELPRTTADAVLAALKGLGFDIDWRAWVNRLNLEHLLDRIDADKKNVQGEVHWIVPRGAGDMEIVKLTKAACRQMLAGMLPKRTGE